MKNFRRKISRSGHFLIDFLSRMNSIFAWGGEGGGGERGEGEGAGYSPISPASNSRSKSKELIIHVI